ncbi:shikimate kinase family protein [Lyngbya aestuarii BL J]|uniref:Shikimate kinase n=1 Tax=Lyngbya aestuarii BL J TaxID=1348334 RepID=U7QIE9_9CYAN|nr:shikimate kinase [Lyngbya aestuarii]ERT06201.1 shikimate kinase family protein [Lyngbya aestuarii BL J]
MNDLLRGINLYLIGMMGAGKTTVGKLLAKEFNYRFIDTDEVITQVAGQSINQIFAEQGEEAFRTLESQVLSGLCAHQRLVVATGGGIILQRANWGYLRHGLIVWLDVSPEDLYQRLKEDTTRPLLQHDNPLGRLQELLEQRSSLYAEADVKVTITPHDTPEQVVDHILEKIPTALKTESPKPPQYNLNPNDLS